MSENKTVDEIIKDRVDGVKINYGWAILAIVVSAMGYGGTIFIGVGAMSQNVGGILITAIGITLGILVVALLISRLFNKLVSKIFKMYTHRTFISNESAVTFTQMMWIMVTPFALSSLLFALTYSYTATALMIGIFALVYYATLFRYLQRVGDYKKMCYRDYLYRIDNENQYYKDQPGRKPREYV